MWNLVVAGLLLLMAAAFYYWSVSGERRSQRIKQIQSTKCKDIEPGRLTEVKGTLKILTPLQVPERPGECAYYRIERQQLCSAVRREADGRIHTTDKWETIEDRTEARRFLVEDESGSVLVDLRQDTEVDAPLIVDRHEEGGKKGGGFGLSLSVGGRPVETKVWALVSGQPLYVLGQAEREGGKIVLKSGADKLLVSYKSEEELLRSTQQDITLGKVVAVLLAGAAAAAFFLIKN